MKSFGKPLRRLGYAFGVWLAFISSASAESLVGINFLQIDPRANIFSAGSSSAVAPGGGGAGILPTYVPVDPIATTTGDPTPMQRAFTLADVSADSTLSADGIRFNSLDGGTSFGGRTQLNGVGGISGINHGDRTMFLTGVFLGDSLPSTAPAALAFNSNTDFTELAPALGQTFFIGDGKSNAGQTQRFLAPHDATRLYLGIADGFNFTGDPGFYDDNQGKINLNYNISAVPVPEPTTLLGWCAAMGAAAAWGIRRRRTMRLS